MPVNLIERLPLPSLRVYTAISVALLSCSVYYAVHVTRDPNWKSNSTSRVNIDGTLEAIQNDSNFFIDDLRHKSSVFAYLSDLVTFMSQEPFCIWVNILILFYNFCLAVNNLNVVCSTVCIAW